MKKENIIEEAIKNGFNPKRDVLIPFRCQFCWKERYIIAPFLREFWNPTTSSKILMDIEKTIIDQTKLPDHLKCECQKMKNKKENLKEKLKELIVRNTEYWLPYGKYDKKKGSCFIIEEKEPFFWRINPKWAEELAEKIIEFFKGRGLNN